jgi:hypothetical protein
MFSPCFAQEYEIGGFYGYGWYNSGTIFSSAGTARAGILNRFAAGAYLDDNRWSYVSGELRYVYQDGHPYLKYNGMRADIQGQSHTITYDLLFHGNNEERRFRPFAAIGAGAKGFLIAGPEPFPQPFPGVATLNGNNQWKFVTDVGGGVKYRLNKYFLLRGDFRDYITTFPSRELTRREACSTSSPSCSASATFCLSAAFDHHFGNSPLVGPGSGFRPDFARAFSASVA